MDTSHTDSSQSGVHAFVCCDSEHASGSSSSFSSSSTSNQALTTPPSSSSSLEPLSLVALCPKSLPVQSESAASIFPTSSPHVSPSNTTTTNMNISKHMLDQFNKPINSIDLVPLNHHTTSHSSSPSSPLSKSPHRLTSPCPFEAYCCFDEHCDEAAESSSPSHHHHPHHPDPPKLDLTQIPQPPVGEICCKDPECEEAHDSCIDVCLDPLCAEDDCDDPQCENAAAAIVVAGTCVDPQCTKVCGDPECGDACEDPRCDDLCLDSECEFNLEQFLQCCSSNCDSTCPSPSGAFSFLGQTSFDAAQSTVPQIPSDFIQTTTSNANNNNSNNNRVDQHAKNVSSMPPPLPPYSGFAPFHHPQTSKGGSHHLQNIESALQGHQYEHSNQSWSVLPTKPRNENDNMKTGLSTSVSAQQFHVCHWQNCHQVFLSMPDLLCHVATDHLGASLVPTTSTIPSQAQVAVPTVNVSSAEHTTLETDALNILSAYAVASALEQQAPSHQQGHQVITIPNGGSGSSLDAAVVPEFEKFTPTTTPIQFAQHSSNATNPSAASAATEPTQAQVNEALLSCLWDDCFAVDPSLVCPNVHDACHLTTTTTTTTSTPSHSHIQTPSSGVFEMDTSAFVTPSSELNNVSQTMHDHHVHAALHGYPTPQVSNNTHSHSHPRHHGPIGEPLSLQTMLRHVLEEHLGVSSEVFNWNEIWNTTESLKAIGIGVAGDTVGGDVSVQQQREQEKISMTERQTVLQQKLQHTPAANVTPSSDLQPEIKRSTSTKLCGNEESFSPIASSRLLQDSSSSSFHIHQHPYAHSNHSHAYAHFQSQSHVHGHAHAHSHPHHHPHPHPRSRTRSTRTINGNKQNINNDNHIHRCHHSQITLLPTPSPSSAHSMSPRPSGSGSRIKNGNGALICLWPNCTYDTPFSSTADLMDHLSEVHVGRGKDKYECLWDGCGGSGGGCGEQSTVTGMMIGGNGGRLFKSRQKVLRHLQSHIGHRPFVCQICEQAFSEAATLAAHMRRHAQEKPFACDNPGCGKRFVTSSALTIHMRRHNGEKPFVCPHCNKGFVEASNLTKHIRIHTGEKPFDCPHPGCGKRFPRPDQLKRHMSVHDRASKNAAALLSASLAQPALSSSSTSSTASDTVSDTAALFVVKRRKSGDSVDDVMDVDVDGGSG